MIKNKGSAKIIQNLEDAGCDCDTIAAVLNDFANGKTLCGIKRLEKHRQILLDDLHENQKQIDCLDYLVYQIKKDKHSLTPKG